MWDTADRHCGSGGLLVDPAGQQTATATLVKSQNGWQVTNVNPPASPLVNGSPHRSAASNNASPGSTDNAEANRCPQGTLKTGKEGGGQTQRRQPQGSSGKSRSHQGSSRPQAGREEGRPDTRRRALISFE
jgi:hypothetical protein